MRGLRSVPLTDLRTEMWQWGGRCCDTDWTLPVTSLQPQVSKLSRAGSAWPESALSTLLTSSPGTASQPGREGETSQLTVSRDLTKLSSVRSTVCPELDIGAWNMWWVTSQQHLAGSWKVFKIKNPTRLLFDYPSSHVTALSASVLYLNLSVTLCYQSVESNN